MPQYYYICPKFITFASKLLLSSDFEANLSSLYWCKGTKKR